LSEDTPKPEPTLLPLVSGGGASYEAVVLCVDRQEEGPFRSAESQTAMALCPSEAKAGMYLINRRIVWGLMGLMMLALLFTASMRASASNPPLTVHKEEPFTH
jgi:hypothetical protein